MKWSLWRALRYGSWRVGCRLYDGKPMLGWFTDYYDCAHLACLHIGPLWVGVEY